MKFFIAIALIAAVATASYNKPAPVSAEDAEIQEIIAAIHSPSTDPATAAALEQLLLDVLGIQPTPVQVGPAIIEQSPVSVGPALIDFPVPDGGAVADVVAPSPVVIGPGPVADATSALVQIIVNINQAGSSPSPSPVSPVVVPEPAPVSPVDIVDVMPVVMPAAPVDVIDVMPVVVPAEPIDVVDVMPVVVPEPVDVVPEVPVDPAVVLPEELN